MNNPKGTRRLSLKALSRLLTTAYLAVLAPMLILSLYSYPAADDFGMGREAHLAFEATGSFFAALGKAFYMAYYYYFNWIGYYSSSFFAAAGPGVFSERLYPLGALFVIGLLHLGVWYLLKVILKDLLKLDRYAVRCITVVTLFLMIQCMPAGAPRQEAFYWYSGSSNYTLMFAIPLLLPALMISFYLEERAAQRRVKYILCLVLAAISGGANYMTALSMAVVMGTFILCVLLAGALKAFEGENAETGARLRMLCIPAVLMLLGLVVSCLAPGNRVRAQGEVGSMSAIKAVLISLHYTLSVCVDEWTGWAVILLLAALWPVWVFAVRRSSVLCGRKYYIPAWIVLLFFYGLASANITPALFAQGNIDAGRIRGLFWMQYALLLVLAEGYIAARIMGKGQAPFEADTGDAGDAKGAGDSFKDTCLSEGSSRAVAGILAAFIILSGLTIMPQTDYFTSAEAVRELASGEAKAFLEESLEREKILKDDSAADAVLPSYRTKPPLLFFGDVAQDPGDWVNYTVQRYYHKNSVVRNGE